MLLQQTVRPVVLLGLIALLGWPAGAAQRRETLIYSRFDIDPGEWRYFEFPAKADEARLDVHFEVLEPKSSEGVRVSVQTEQEFQRFRENQPYQTIGSSDYRSRGSLRMPLPAPGGYAVVVDNRHESRRRCRVELEVSLTTGPAPETLPVTYASPRKRLIVVSVSLAGFLAVLVLSGQALWRRVRTSRGRFQ